VLERGRALAVVGEQRLAIADLLDEMSLAVSLDPRVDQRAHVAPVGALVARETDTLAEQGGGLHAEALSSAELRHGPLALAGPDFPVMLFSQNDAALAGRGLGRR